jgi:uncharacterized damage-inducible protein DinB
MGRPGSPEPLASRTVVMSDMEDPRYPIGPFQFDGQVDPARRSQRIDEIAAAPGHLRAAIAGLTPAQLDTPYREKGWTVRQVVHHVPDSHLNAYTRIKLALTEDEPTIKPYEEARWAELPDMRGPVEISLALLESLHRRWVLLLRELTPADLNRRFRHPEHGRTMALDEVLALYAWHGRHHVAHITSLRRRMGWN